MADPDPLLAWLYLQQGVKTIEESLSATMEEHCGCTLSEHSTLYRLKTAKDQRLTMAELSELLSISPSGVTRLVDRLVRRGWVERVQPPDNRRTVCAVPTEEGLRVLQGQTMVVYWQSVNRHFESILDAEDLAAAARIGRKMLEANGRWDEKRFAPGSA
ncbi:MULTISPECIES: MarR family winged helix-turn-helix transcriptional regulator [unclassified Kutzneria]|uniref:MarR family winged helix-turn-helix transcriptional regulator n=1 Tax=unclassified Kutzneria TaxID=2621979 RepID=UPI0003EEDF0D|nr:MarR family transcriptional regulator [Kutzneria sp. 744]EWM16790.1 transcriptional regulator, MarR family [Kutzneria sp. 744]